MSVTLQSPAYFVGDDSSYNGSFDTVDAHSFDSFMEQSQGFFVGREQIGKPVGNNAAAQAADNPATGGNANGFLDQDEFDRNNLNGDDAISIDDIDPNNPDSTTDLSSALQGDTSNGTEGADRLDGDSDGNEIESGRGNDTIYANTLSATFALMLMQTRCILKSVSLTYLT